MGNKTFLITGGCGFIGSCLIRELSKSKDNHIINIDKLTYASNTLSIGDLKDKNYTFYKEDITDEVIVDKILKKTNPNYVIHLAAITDATSSFDKKDIVEYNNYNSTNSVLQYCINSGIKVIIMSSASVYGTHNSPVD